MEYKVWWHRVTTERRGVTKVAVLSGRRDKVPGRGVWVAALSREDGGQTTHEAIAVDGVIVFEAVCRCGYDRHCAWKRAEALVLGGVR